MEPIYDGYTTADRKTPEPFPLNSEDLPVLHTVMTRNVADGYFSLGNRAVESDFLMHNQDLAFEMECAANLLYDQLTATLCRRFVEMSQDELDKLFRDEMYTREINRNF